MSHREIQDLSILRNECMCMCSGRKAANEAVQSYLGGNAQAWVDSLQGVFLINREDHSGLFVLTCEVPDSLFTAGSHLLFQCTLGPVSPVSFSHWKKNPMLQLMTQKYVPHIDFLTRWFQVESLWKRSRKCDSRSINAYVTWRLHCIKEHLLCNYNSKLFSRVCCIARWGRLKGIYVCWEDFVVCSHTTRLQRSLRAYQRGGCDYTHLLAISFKNAGVKPGSRY